MTTSHVDAPVTALQLDERLATFKSELNTELGEHFTAFERRLLAVVAVAIAPNG